MAGRSRTSFPVRSDPSRSRRARIRRDLLQWYDRNRRDLPWRRRPGDPYAQWVAEIMLQQTRVETVIPYYERFMRRFPDVASLARAKEDTVLKLWEGLGYYRRVQHIYRAARQLRDRGRAIPSTAADLALLPGVGAYTAAAIASIAHGERVAAVDGNVARVLARLFGVRDDVLGAKGRHRITALADDLIPQRRPGDFNQAWMDLGSLVCTPRAPRCEKCPLRSGCVARETNSADSIPVRGANGTTRPREVHVAVAVLNSGSRLLVRRRPPGGLWSGLWEFPGEEIAAPGDARRRVRGMMRGLGLATNGGLRAAGEVRHQLTHRLMVFHPFLAQVALNGRRDPTLGGMRWVTRHGFARLSVSRAQRKIHEAFCDPCGVGWI